MLLTTANYGIKSWLASPFSPHQPYQQIVHNLDLDLEMLLNKTHVFLVPDYPKPMLLLTSMAFHIQ